MGKTALPQHGALVRPLGGEIRSPCRVAGQKIEKYKSKPKNPPSKFLPPSTLPTLTLATLFLFALPPYVTNLTRFCFPLFVFLFAKICRYMYIFLFILSYIKRINIVYIFCLYLTTTEKKQLTICPRNHSLSVHVYLPHFISAASYSIHGMDVPVLRFPFLMLKDFGSFQYFATSNNVAVNNLVHVYFCIVGGVSSG